MSALRRTKCTAVKSHLVDYLVGGSKERGRDAEGKGFCNVGIDHQLVLCWKSEWKVSRFGAVVADSPRTSRTAEKCQSQPLPVIRIIFNRMTEALDRIRTSKGYWGFGP